MKLGVLKAIGHNIADSLASGIGLMIGCYAMDVFAEAAGEPEGFVVVNFLAGTATGRTVSSDFRKAVAFYSEALPTFCAKHGVELTDLTRLEARFGTDPVYGRHFTVMVQGKNGKQSTDQYVGTPGRRFRPRRQPRVHTA